MAPTPPLTDKAIRAALGKAQKDGTPLRLPDSDGLRLDVQPTGAAWWRLRYRHAGKEGMLSLGTYPDVSLSQARERRDEARRQLAAGINPSEQRKAGKAEAEREREAQRLSQRRPR